MYTRTLLYRHSLYWIPNEKSRNTPFQEFYCFFFFILFFNAWEAKISRAGGAFVYSDGILLEGGMASVELVPWDGEVPGMAEGLAGIPENVRGVLILADSKAAIAVVGRMGKASSRHLKKVVHEIAERVEGGGVEGGGVVKVGWVKAHTGNKAAPG